MRARGATCTLAASTIALALSAAPVAADVETIEAVAISHGVDAVGVELNAHYVGVFESWRARARAEGFSAVEEALLSQAALSGETEATADIAYFYFATGFFPEASAVIRSIDESARPPALLLLEGAAAIKMGRWREAVELLSRPPLKNHADAAPWRGIAYVELGAFDAAAGELLRDGQSTVPFEEHATQYYLAQAQAALAIGHLDPARAALENVRNRIQTQYQRDQRRLLEARVLLARGETGAAVGLLNALSRTGEAPISFHAQLDLLRHKQRTGAASKLNTLKQLREISLRWRGGAVERELLEMEASLREMSGDVINAVTARRKLLNRFPESDAARAAERDIRTALSSILSDTKLPPREAANAFYENIDLAPPGAEGDAMIRDAAEILTGLDLLTEASELLRHQVFERLRGTQRSEVAADLAELYLADNKPAAAIDVIENTRRTQLLASVVARRAYLEADANFRRGDADRALSIINERQDFAALTLRGRILSTRGDRAGAGAAFAAAASVGEGQLSSEQMNAAILAASAYVQTGDKKALRALSNNLKERVASGAAKDLFGAIVSDELPHAPSDFGERYDAFFGG